jgi:hypothetical protein
MLNSRDTGDFHSKTSLDRMLNVLHNDPLLEFSLYLGFISIYHGFEFEEKLILDDNAIL